MEHGKLFIRASELFKKFPSIGQRQADRFAGFIAKADSAYVKQLSESILQINSETKQCPSCFLHHEGNELECELCLNNQSSILVLVEKDIDIFAIESALEDGEKYRYFILGGLIPIAGEGRLATRLNEFQQRIKEVNPQEIILAFSVHPDADHTLQFISNILKESFPKIKVSLLGRGLSSGSELEYSSPETLQNALKRRD